MEYMKERLEILASAPRYDVVSGGRKGGKAAETERWIREQEIEQGKYIEGNRYTWYKSLHYSDQAWGVLKDRAWSLKQARR